MEDSQRENGKNTIKIMITGTYSFTDNGEVAMLVGAIYSLKKQYPHAIFYMGSVDKSDTTRIKEIFPDLYQDIHLVQPGPFATRRLPWQIRTLSLFIRYIPAIIKCNIVVHVGADGYGDVTYGGPLSTMSHSYQLLLGKSLRKPVVVCAMTVGPFNWSLSRWMANFTLDRVSLILIREKVTLERLQKMGIKKTLHLVADLGFLVEPSGKERVDYLLKQQGINGQRPLACLATSETVSSRIQTPESPREKSDLYIRMMADIADYFYEKGMDVILTNQTTGLKNDDYIISQRISEKCRHKPFIMPRSLSPQDLKGIFGRSEIVVACKMHSSILATGLGIPTVILGYHSKLYGIFWGIPEQTEFIVDTKASSFAGFQKNLMTKIEDCWQRRFEIREKIKNRIPEVKKSSLSSSEIIRNFLDNHN
jgi:polysaccharide pyruvyl transferase WcaK-like protein